ncbi:MAG: protein translocase subunit SecD [Bacteroidetes bacterium]|nr:protein translocase subunit SecD [Bacteroidota bacterium]
MLQFEGWKKALVLLISVLGFIFAAPNLMPDDSDGQGPLYGQKINLGLDLQGGSHLLLSVDMDVVVNERLEGFAERIRQDFRGKKIRYRGLGVKGSAVSVSLRNADDAETAREIFRELGTNVDVVRDGTDYIIRFNEGGRTALQTSTLDQSMEIIRRRIDPDGTKEPIIQRQGSDRILVQLPGVDDPEEIKRLLGRTAKLTFQLVDTSISAQEARDRGRVPPGSVLLPSDNENSGDFYVVEKRVMVSGELLETAQATFDENNRPAVSFTLNSLGAKRFGRVTGANIGRPFAIILDGKVVSAPTIQSQIFGSAQITGSFTVSETNELALILRAGALPAPLTVMEERSIGPGLGADSVAAGKIAAIVGLMLVIIYMVVSYGMFGLLADIALGVNVVLILAALSTIQATLTLPGIAGIVLTMGMAVDANVLVFERIREELRRGRSVMAAVEGGYQRAISTIVDSNLTTLFAALFLYIFGSGPIKGFAVTLSIGIATSLFTAVMVTRLLIVIWLERKRPKTLVL